MDTFFGLLELCQQFSLGAGGKGMPPEVYARGMAARVRLHARTVHRNHRQAVGHAVSPLDQLPGLALLRLLPIRVCGYAADGGGVNQQFGPVQGHGPGGLGIPLVPAHQHAQGAQRGLDGLKAQVSRGKVELLVKQGVVRDVHLAVLAGYAAVGLQDHGGVVVDAGGAALEKGKHQHHPQFPCQRAEALGRGAGDGFGQVAQLGVLFLAEVKAVVQFLQNNQLGAPGGGLADISFQTGHVARNIGGAVLLHHSYFDFSHLYREN